MCVEGLGSSRSMVAKRWDTALSPRRSIRFDIALGPNRRPKNPKTRPFRRGSTSLVKSISKKQHSRRMSNPIAKSAMKDTCSTPASLFPATDSGASIYDDTPSVHCEPSNPVPINDCFWNSMDTLDATDEFSSAPTRDQLFQYASPQDFCISERYDLAPQEYNYGTMPVSMYQRWPEEDHNINNMFPTEAFETISYDSFSDQNDYSSFHTPNMYPPRYDHETSNMGCWPSSPNLFCSDNQDANLEFTSEKIASKKRCADDYNSISNKSGKVYSPHLKASQPGPGRSSRKNVKSLLHKIICHRQNPSPEVIQKIIEADPSACYRSIEIHTKKKVWCPKSSRIIERVCTEPYSYPLNLAIYKKLDKNILVMLAEAAPQVLMKPDGSRKERSISILLRARSNDVELIHQFLVKRPQAAKTLDRFRTTPLHVACASGAPIEAVKQLYSISPESIKVRNLQGVTPWDDCLRSQRCEEEVVDFIRQKID